MDLRNWFRSSLILLIAMIVLLFIVIALSGGAVGPLEILVWLAILLSGIILCGFGSRSRST